MTRLVSSPLSRRIPSCPVRSRRVYSTQHCLVVSLPLPSCHSCSRLFSAVTSYLVGSYQYGYLSIQSCLVKPIRARSVQLIPRPFSAGVSVQFMSRRVPWCRACSLLSCRPIWFRVAPVHVPSLLPRLVASTPLNSAQLLSLLSCLVTPFPLLAHRVCSLLSVRSTPDPRTPCPVVSLLSCRFPALHASSHLCCHATDAPGRNRTRH